MDDAYPLPRIDDLLIKQGKNTCFSVMDLKDAFHQVPLHPDSRPYTGTDTPIGIQQWNVVPTGWKNGVAYCQRNLEVGLAPVSDIASGCIQTFWLIPLYWKKMLPRKCCCSMTRI